MAEAIHRSKAESENLIRKVWHDTQKAKFIHTKEQIAVIAAIALTLCHFEEDDRMYGTIHAKIFREVYLSNDPIAQKDFNSRKLLSEAAMEIRFDGNGCSVSPYTPKSDAKVTDGKRKKRKKKPIKRTRRDSLAYEIGVSVRSLSEYTGLYIMYFEEKLNSITLNNNTGT